MRAPAGSDKGSLAEQIGEVRDRHRPEQTGDNAQGQPVGGAGKVVEGRHQRRQDDEVPQLEAV